MTDKLMMRLSYSKNMMPLDLSTWGGGLQLNYSLQETKDGPIYPGGDRFLGRQSRAQPVALHELRGFVRVLHEPDEHARA